MESNLKRKTVQSLLYNMEKGKISLDHKLQRAEGQWDATRKSNLIDSLLRNIPLNPAYVCKDDDVLGVIDGVQRFSTIRDFVNNEFACVKMDEDYPLILNGERKDISGLKFKKLDEDTKQALLNTDLQYYEVSDYTEKDIKVLFERLNSGKPLNSRQMRVIYESDIVNMAINELISHPFMLKLISKTQRKNSADRDTIRETIMLLTGKTSFAKKDINDFIANEIDNHIDKFDDIRNVLDILDKNIEKIKLPITTAPFLLYAACKAASENKDMDNFVKAIIEFADNYKDNAAYKECLKEGTTSSTSINARFQYWNNLLETI